MKSLFFILIWYIRFADQNATLKIFTILVHVRTVDQFF
jgi:hypothetical protein